ncbi:MAG TPA: hypothetical protein VIC27_04590, partial [Ktedonobacterales bacterium]
LGRSARLIAGSERRIDIARGATDTGGGPRTPARDCSALAGPAAARHGSCSAGSSGAMAEQQPSRPACSG